MKTAFAQRVSALEEMYMVEAKEKSAQFYKPIFKSLSEAVFIARGSRIQWCNKAAAAILGYSREELKGKFLGQLFLRRSTHKGNGNLLYHQVQKVGHAQGIVKLKLKSGGAAEVEITLLALGVHKAASPEIVVVARETGKHKSFKDSSSYHGHGLRAILSNMAEGVVVENGAYEIEFMNKAMVRRFGNKVGRKCYRAFIGRNTPCPDCSVKEILHKRKRRFEYTATDREGRCYELVATPLKNEDGSVSVIEVIRDVTEKKAVERLIRREKEVSHHIVRSIADGVITADVKGIITSCNPAMRNKLGCSKSSMLGKKVWDILKPISRAKWREAFQNIQQTPKKLHWADVQLKYNGREDIVNVKIVPLTDDLGQVTGTIIFFEYLTEKIRALELAKESERFFEILLRDISESVFVIKNRKIFWCNRGAEQVLGYSRRELIGRSPARFFPSQKTFRDFSTTIYRALAHRNRYDVVTPLKRKSGGILNMELSLSVMRRTDGRVTEVIVVGRDITARMKTERESKERKRRLTILNKVTAKITSSIQLKHVLLYSAKSILKLTGLDSCSIVLYDEATSSLRDFISIGLNKVFQKSLKWRLRSGGVTEWVVKQKKPLVIPDTIKDPRSAVSRATKEAGVRALVAVPILSKSKVIGLIVVNSFSPGRVSSDVVLLISSIASQAAGAIENAKLYKQVSKKVNELSALHLVGNTLVSSLDVPDLLGEVVTVLGKSFGYNYCSILLLDRKKMELTIGAAHGVPQKTIRNLSIKAEEKGITGWVARTGKPLYVPDVHQDPRYLGGIKGIKSELAVPLKRGKAIIGVLDVESKEANAFGERDLRVLTTVAAQMAMAIENAKLFENAKQAYKDLKAAQADVVQAGKMAAVGQLAAGIAHELNNPIGGIMGYAQFALKKMQFIDVTGEHEEEIAQLERYLGYIERESQRCKNIVQNLLNFSRTSPIGYQPTDVNHVIRESFQFLEYELNLNNIVVSKTLSKNLPLIMGNENQLQQVFLNMIMNAHKAMPHKGNLTVTTRRVKDDERCKDLVEVVFSDTGCGIAQEHIDHIFEPFFTTRNIGEGTGLGLSVSYRIVKNHGGEILVNSKITQGSTFVVRLPVNNKPRETKPKTDVET